MTMAPSIQQHYTMSDEQNFTVSILIPLVGWLSLKFVPPVMIINMIYLRRNVIWLSKASSFSLQCLPFPSSFSTSPFHHFIVLRCFYTYNTTCLFAQSGYFFWIFNRRRFFWIGWIKWMKADEPTVCTCFFIWCHGEIRKSKVSWIFLPLNIFVFPALTVKKFSEKKC